MPFMENKHQTPTETEIESAQRAQRIRIKNRRKLYLDRQPSYFTSPDLELADPLLYDRCIRRFQSAAEREADGRAKGYSGVLEADLYRSEAKLAAMKGKTLRCELESSPSDATITYLNYPRDEDGGVVPEDPDEAPQSKEEGLERWKFEMMNRFLKGDDIDFDYEHVDHNDEYDIIESKEKQERWFDDEEPEWVDVVEPGVESVGGETGIQDF